MSSNTVGKGNYEPLVSEDDRTYENNDRNIQFAPNPQKVTWDHIQNLDQFFSDIYKYHQKGGFNVLLLTQIFWLVKFIFVIFISIELSACTKWADLTNSSIVLVQWNDIFIPPNQCWVALPLPAALVVVFSILFIIAQIVYSAIKLNKYYEVRRFCTNILNLPTTDIGLADFTWSEVQSRLLQSQKDYHLCVFKLCLDELDIYNRILRHNNYLIAMVNKDIIPLRFNIPFSHDYVYLSDGYLLNLKLILFWSPWSPFQNYWQLRAEYKWLAKRHELAARLATHIRVIGFINLLLSPLIFICQLVMIVCSNAERIRDQPGTVFGRQWSNFARLYLRHFNELHHEFADRVSQAYVPASRYLNSFVSRSLTVTADTCAFIFGGLSLAFLIASSIDNQIMHLSGYLVILVGGGIIARASLSLIPDENVVYCPRNLLLSTLTRINYMPDHWKENAGTYKVRSEFSQLFQYRLVGLLEELLSPIITPMILIFVLPYHSLEIVDFLRNYTVDVPGVGDVCSFAQLDIRKHGDPLWQPDIAGNGDVDDCTGHHLDPKFGKESNADNGISQNESVCHDSALCGKTELSLMHFHLTNPSWPLRPDGLAYLKSVKQQAIIDFHSQQQQLMNMTDNIRSNMPNSDNPMKSASCLFSATYANPQTDQTVPGHDGLKNKSHLPGPSVIPEDSHGLVGALVESIKSSGSQSMYHSTDHDANKTRLTSVAGDSKTKYGIDKSLYRPYPAMQASHFIQGMPPNFPIFDGATPATVSLMAASAIHLAENAGLPPYQPYISQTEEALVHQFGMNNGMGSNMTNRPYLHAPSADMSLSAFYIHELHNRRCQRMRNQGTGTTSFNSQRPMIDSTPGIQSDHLQTSNTAGINILPTKFNPNIPSYSMSSTSNYSRPPINRSSVEYPEISSTNYNYSGEPGIMRTYADNRRLPSLFAEVREEDDENRATCRPRLDSTSNVDLRENTNNVGGIITVPGNAPVHYVQRPSELSSTPVLETDDPVEMWPDLPPTNC